jgi:hypothetical protein
LSSWSRSIATAGSGVPVQYRLARASLDVRRRKSTAVLVRFAETARREKLKPQAIVSAPAEGITLPKLDHGKDDLQCG